MEQAQGTHRIPAIDNSPGIPIRGWQVLQGLLQHPRTELLTVATIALALLVPLTLRSDLLTYSNPGFSAPFDHHKYIHMAEGNPFGFHIAPFCWRVVTPLLAKALPFSLEANFLLITFMSVWLTAVVFYSLARRYQFSREQALVGMLLLLSLGFTTKQLLGDFWLTDPLSVFVIVLAIFCIVTRRDLAYALVLAIGVGVREDVLLVAPLYYTLNAERVVDLRLAARTVLLTLPALAVFFGLRHFITPLNHDPAYLKSLPLDQRVVYGGGGKYYTSFNYVDIIRESIVHPLFAAQRMLPHLVFVLRSMVILLPFLAFVRSWKAIVRFAPFVLLLFAQLFFIDTNRYVTAAFVIFTLWALFGVSDLSRRLEIPAIVFAGLPLLFIALNLLSVSQIDAPTPVQVAVLAAYAAGIGLITLRRRPPSTARSAAV